MIDEKRTKQRFGYTSDILSHGSGKIIMVVCDACGVVMERKMSAYNTVAHPDLCYSCIRVKLYGDIGSVVRIPPDEVDDASNEYAIQQEQRTTIHNASEITNTKKMTEEGWLPNKLDFELVPSTIWYSNMRKMVTRSTWDKIRKQTYAEYGHRCGICGASGRMECHEIWKYDDCTHIQSLVGFISLCGMCHHVKHIGLAAILARKGQLDYQKVIDHYIQVNGCTENEFKNRRARVFDQYRERSAHEWKTDFGDYVNVVTNGLRGTL